MRIRTSPCRRCERDRVQVADAKEILAVRRCEFERAQGRIRVLGDFTEPDVARHRVVGERLKGMVMCGQ